MIDASDIVSFFFSVLTFIFPVTVPNCCFNSFQEKLCRLPILVVIGVVGEKERVEFKNLQSLERNIEWIAKS